MSAIYPRTSSGFDLANASDSSSNPESHAIAAQRQGGPPNSSVHVEPFPPYGNTGGNGTEPVQISTASSVRVNLSVPAEVDAILCGLARRTGGSKASFVMQALNWYLPELTRKLADFESAPRVELGVAKRDLAPVATELLKDGERVLSRAERRRLEKQQRRDLRKLGVGYGR